MTDTPHIAEPAASRSPRRALLIVVCVLTLCWLAFPAPVASWVYDNCGEAPYCPALQVTTDSVEVASRHLGIAGWFEAMREQVRLTFGIDFY